MRTGLILAAALGLVVSASVASAQEREFGAWRVTCDNLLRCSAVGAQDGETAFVVVSRDAGPDAEPEIVIGLQPGDDTGLTSADPLIVTVDGRQRASLSRDRAAGGAVAQVTGAEARRLASALRDGRRLELLAGRLDGVSVPLDGSAAAFLWMDERQGRVRNLTALASAGDGPASAVTRPPAAPVLTRVFLSGSAPTALPAALERDPAIAQCREDSSVLEEASRLTAVRMPDGGVLWGYVCEVGAYNVSTRWWRTDAAGGGLAPYAFPTSSGREEALTNAGFNPATSSLSEFAKGRGLGDCGVAREWVLTAEGFQLSHESAMTRCVGVTPDFWPRTWHAEVR